MTLKRPEPKKDEDFITHPSDEARASFGEAYERIVGLMARLRGPGGCPWDREQDLMTLRAYLIEESYEVLEALEKGDPEEHKEELGDLLLQIVFQAEIRREEGAFDAADVAHAIADKLVRRHPHVFGDDQQDVGSAAEGRKPKAAKSATGPDQAFARWEEMKAKEKGGRLALAGVPSTLPALLRAQRVQEKAQRVGFDWPTIDGPLDKVHEELKELEAAIATQEPQAIEHELGDVLFSIVNVARFLKTSAEDTLRASIARFSRRFEYVEAQIRAQNKTLAESTLEEMEALWQEAKTKGQ